MGVKLAGLTLILSLEEGEAVPALGKVVTFCFAESAREDARPTSGWIKKLI